VPVAARTAKGRECTARKGKNPGVANWREKKEAISHTRRLAGRYLREAGCEGIVEKKEEKGLRGRDGRSRGGGVEWMRTTLSVQGGRSLSVFVLWEKELAAQGKSAVARSQ